MLLSETQKPSLATIYSKNATKVLPGPSHADAIVKTKNEKATSFAI